MWQSMSIGRPVAGTGQTLAVGATAATSTAFGSQTYAIHVSSLANCHIRVGSTPTAVATDLLLKASDPPLIIHVAPNEKLSVIQDGTSTGNLTLIELTN